MHWASRPRVDYGAGLRGIMAGEGPPLVLIHGVGLTADSWGAQIEVLSRSFEIHALDLPGHGASEPLVTLPSLAILADHLCDALTPLGETVFVAGHSLGALVTMALAVRRPGLVGAMAALNAVHRRTPHARAAVMERASSLSSTHVADPAPTLKRWFGDNLETPEARACGDWLTSATPGAYKVAYQLFAKSDSPPDEELSGLQCPALFLTGSEEPNSTPDMSRAMAALVPDADLVIVPDAAHMAMMTHPVMVTEALHSFFSTATARVPSANSPTMEV